MKKGDVIDLENGGTFKLPWTPVKSTGGKGAQRKWHGVTDDMWRELYEALANYDTKCRNEVCKHYSVSYQKLLKSFGDQHTLTKSIKSAVANNPMARIEMIKAKIAKHEMAIEELNAELSDAKEKARELLEKQIEELTKL